MTKHNITYILWLFGILLLVSSIILGYQISADIKQLGLAAFQQADSPLNSIMFFSFAFFFPIGILFLFVGGIKLCHKQGLNLVIFIVMAVVLSFIMLSWPAIVGRNMLPMYFGISGIIMLSLIILTVWQWAHYRHRASHGIRRALDFKALGYFCFALAAWNTCGMLSLPGYGIYPDIMQQQFNYNFVVGQAKVIMLYFILGWAFTLVGMRLAWKASTG